MTDSLPDRPNPRGFPVPVSGKDPSLVAALEPSPLSAPAKFTPSAESVAQLERRVERLSLLCQAMWELLCEHTNLSNAQLADKALEVDLRDGRADNKMAVTVGECPHCKARTNSRRTTCVICGMELSRPHSFQV